MLSWGNISCFSKIHSFRVLHCHSSEQDGSCYVGVTMPPDHILNVDHNLEAKVRELKCFITSILSKL
jgi:hypothetical protein